MSGDVDIIRHGAVAEIVLNRPDKHNAMTAAMTATLCDACRDLNDDRNISALVLSGAGDRAFSAGTDLHAIDDYDDIDAFLDDLNYVAQIRGLTKPVVAALKGWVLGGGLEMAAACDIRVAATSARFGAPEVTLGWIGGGGTSQFLPALIGYGQAMKLLATGDHISSDEALRIGLIEELVAPGEERPRALALAARIAEHPGIASRSVKQAVRAALDGGLTSRLRLEREMMAYCFATGNGRSGAARFAGRKEQSD